MKDPRGPPGFVTDWLCDFSTHTEGLRIFTPEHEPLYLQREHGFHVVRAVVWNALYSCDSCEEWKWCTWYFLLVYI